jgi:hypothetical protein
MPHLSFQESQWARKKEGAKWSGSGKGQAANGLTLPSLVQNQIVFLFVENKSNYSTLIF